MLVLFETPAGYALFKLTDESKLEDVEALQKSFATPEKASKLVKLQAFKKFDDMEESLAATTSLLKSKLHKTLSKFLEKNIVKKSLQDQLAVLDTKLGAAIQEKLEIDCIFNKSIAELQRGIRSQISTLISDISDADMHQVGLGLAHSMSRYKLKFSPDKVDTMIVQAIGLLDDLDKELNTYAMRVREWYGWHFPEMAKIVTDNIHYAKAARLMGMRTNCKDIDFSEFLPEEQETEMKEAAEISMGTEISETDISHVSELCDQVVSIAEYRAQLFEYLCNRMQAVAPNLTILVGELVGARLIAHAGSLMSLAKQPASTVQILGAEKALFRALKTKVETPKYGLIYHASLIGQSAPKFKGKISRVLAAKCALSIRVDALGDKNSPAVGIEHRAAVEARLRQLEGKTVEKLSGAASGKQKDAKYNGASKADKSSYNEASDSTLKKKKHQGI